MSNQSLPTHIRQLVDKKNYVIAIKTHAEEQGISMEEAKNQIDAYEAQATAQGQAGLAGLQHGLDNHLQTENIKVPFVPRYVWRITAIILVLVGIGWLLYRLIK